MKEGFVMHKGEGYNFNKVWQAGNAPHFESLSGDIETDVLIIGGGLTGLLCAYKLNNARIPYILVEKGGICQGITQNTTAKITFQHGLIYDKLIRKFGVEKARLYLEANRTSLERYREICKNVDCDFEERDLFIYSTKNLSKLEKEVSALEKIGQQAQLVKDIPLPLSVCGAVKVSSQAQFNPLKFAAHISKGLNILENTKVLEIGKRGARTERGIIHADKIIVATHFPIINKHGGYFLKMYQHRSYVIALKGASLPYGMYVDEDENGLSFRNYKELLLLGGMGHRTGKKGGGFDSLASLVKKLYPQSKEVYRFATQDCMTLDGMPYIGQYGKNTPNLYVATGFNKWGMSSAMVAANILCDMMLKKDNPYISVFSPSRNMLHPKLLVNALEASINLITPTVPRCPHMGCALKFNKEEGTWDCPCHGSRFSPDGTLLDGPSTDDKRPLGKRQRT